MATPNNEITSTQPREIDYIRILLHCLRKWYWFVIAAFVSVAFAVFYLQHKNNQYATTATIMIRNEGATRRGNSSVPQADMMELMGFSLSKVVEDEIEIITSYNIMAQTVRALGLQTDYRKKSRFRWIGQYPTPDVAVSYPSGYLDTLSRGVLLELERTEKNYKLKVHYGKQEESFVLSSLNEELPTIAGPLTLLEIHPLEPGDKMRIQSAPLQAVANSYRARLSCAQIKKESNVIRISMVSDVPARSRDIISKVIDLYNMDAVIDKNIMATNTGNFINDRLRIVTLELDTVEGAVEQYMKDNNLSDMTKQVDLVLNSKSQYQKQLTDLETQINLLTYIQEYLQEPGNEHNLIPGNLGVQDASLSTLMQAYNRLALDRSRLSRSAQEGSPLMLQTDEQMAALRSSVLSSIQNQKEGLNITRRDVMSKDSEFNAMIRKAPEKERRYMEIKRQQEIKEKLYIYLYQKREENALTLASTVMPAKVIDAPQTSVGPVAPRRMRILGLVVLIGLAIPFGIIFLLNYFNNEIQDKKEFQSVVKAPFLGSIIQGKDKNKAIVVGQKVNTTAAELFRTIRTNLKFMLPEGKTPVILVTSALNGEGKSYVAINSAISMALLGKRVVLVGLDIRKPTLSKYMQIEFKGAVTSYLSDSSVSIDDLVMPSGIVDGLDVAPAGIIPPNPGELIQSPRMADLFAELRNRYDYVIVDTAPVQLVSDTYLLSKYADVTLFVTRANYLSREMLPVIQEIYEQQKLPNMACVLNGVNVSKGGYGYGRYGHYGHYGRYGYGHYGHYGYGQSDSDVYGTGYYTSDESSK